MALAASKDCGSACGCHARGGRSFLSFAFLALLSSKLPAYTRTPAYLCTHEHTAGFFFCLGGQWNGGASGGALRKTSSSTGSNHSARTHRLYTFFRLFHRSVVFCTCAHIFALAVRNFTSSPFAHRQRMLCCAHIRVCVCVYACSLLWQMISQLENSSVCGKWINSIHTHTCARTTYSNAHS